MAKTRQRSFAPLPLSDAFYGRLSHTARALGLGHPGDDALAQAVSALSRTYTRARDTIRTHGAAHDALTARALFFLPRDLTKVLGPVADLVRLGHMPERPVLRVLDLGAGLGSTTLGLARALTKEGRAHKLEVTAFERDEKALAFFRALARETNQLTGEFCDIALHADVRDVTVSVPSGPFDVILLGFVLNELYAEAPENEQVRKRAELLVRLAGTLAEGGVILALEPALKEVARALMAVRDALAARNKAPFVLAPCVHVGPCPMLTSERDWCHEELPYALPPALAKVARMAGLRWEGLSYAALVLGQAPREPHLGHIVRVVSERLETKGKLELYGCSERGYVRYGLLNRDANEHNRAFTEARRGHELVLESESARLTKDTRVKRA